MPVEIVMPKLGLTMTEGLILEWKKKEGDQVKKGEILFVLQTEKVTFEVESPEDGILAKILVHKNETVPVGAIVAYLLRPGEDISDLEAIEELSAEKPSVEPEEAEEVPSRPARKTIQKQADLTKEIGVKASPLAKKLAKTYKIDLRTVRGTGPGGRITRKDVEKAYEKIQEETAKVDKFGEEAPGQRLAPFTPMRRAIAEKMMASKVKTAQTYMANSVDASKIVEYRKVLLPYVQEKFDVRITITDMMMKIVAAAIREHPIINTRWTEEGILYFEDVHMGMAMALEEGLIVPVIRDVNKKGLAQIAKDRTELIRKGKEGKLLPDDVTGSTFTLSAMGMYGVEQFTANINVPENAILAVGAIIEKPVVFEGEVVIRPTMNVCLTYDHRTIDGAEAGKFMRTLKLFIENPIMILA
ncbi:MAG: 2-oxo acid dehydrogenase subunit E2 [Deltaproteobacteria bacterium]|nr:2-oxo acid dehydrogenase subunit E2 [Deltaproteobacteria bacterium]MBW2025338.1 2-oxo acid dehydrogenase subunit E2 [Deltaproteobacteria bacterium]MBW2125205.1 2-oxo acid dehydrogenase subunit E2 [Deltaproteobacteria bacterium]